MTDLLISLCSVPTAPFIESRVVAFVEQFVRDRRKHLTLSRDRFGNLLIATKSRGTASAARWVFTAHMDHPGFVADRMAGPRTLEARFHGGVLSTYVQGAKVRYFQDNGAEVRGTVTDVTDGDRGYPARARLKVAGDVAPGSPGMFDVGAGRVKGKRFLSRVCDDLAGAAAALAMLDSLIGTRTKSPIAVLLTRAEEEGFIGAMAAVRARPSLLKKTDRVIAIECSAAQPYAPQGAGCIVRVGDRTSVFNSAISYFITEQATVLAKVDKTFKYQRALMPGGTCEATVYDAYGYTAGSICVPLGNYHNMDKATGRIAAEYIDLNDWTSMVRLFVTIARNGHAFEPGMKGLKQRLMKRFGEFEKYL
jgi:putative aminopeptidase FrvX